MSSVLFQQLYSSDVTSSKIFRKYAITRTGYQFFFFYETEGGGYYDYYTWSYYTTTNTTTKYLVDTICMGVCTTHITIVFHSWWNTSCELWCYKRLLNFAHTAFACVCEFCFAKWFQDAKTCQKWIYFASYSKQLS